MSRFAIHAGPVLVGHSDLENGDPAVGVAAGRFLPVAAYAMVQTEVVAARDASQVHLQLRVLTRQGEELAAQGSVQIVDYSTEFGAEGLEVQVLGIDPQRYAVLFPDQVQADEMHRTKAR